jgi:type I restriction enzyme, R subunit
LDDYVYTADDQVIEGEIEEGRRYTEDDFNRVIEIKEREHYRVKLFMGRSTSARRRSCSVPLRNTR